MNRSILYVQKLFGTNKVPLCDIFKLGFRSFSLEVNICPGDKPILYARCKVANTLGWVDFSFQEATAIRKINLIFHLNKISVIFVCWSELKFYSSERKYATLITRFLRSHSGKSIMHPSFLSSLGKYPLKENRHTLPLCSF